MNNAEYKKQINELEAEIARLNKDLADVKREYIQAANFKPGDRVIAEYNGVKSFAFVSHIEINWLTKDHEYVLNKQKSDGTQSKIRGYFGLSPKIEHAPQW